MIPDNFILAFGLERKIFDKIVYEVDPRAIVQLE
jgi:hypothetical protein